MIWGKSAWSGLLPRTQLHSRGEIGLDEVAEVVASSRQNVVEVSKNLKWSKRVDRMELRVFIQLATLLSRM